MLSVPMRPSVAATAPYRPFGVHSWAPPDDCGRAAEQADAGELLHADGEAHVDLAGLHRHDRRAQCGGTGGARVRDVEHRDAGLADLLLDLLADAARAHQVAGGEDADVGHRDPTVGQGGEDRLGGEVDDVLVRILAELGHVDPEDPDVVTCAHGYLSVFACSIDVCVKISETRVSEILTQTRNDGVVG